MPDALPTCCENCLRNLGIKERADDRIAEFLADRLADLIPTSDLVTRRTITNAMRAEAGLEPYATTIGRKRLAKHYGTTVRDIREIEERAIEKLRLGLSEFITPRQS